MKAIRAFLLTATLALRVAAPAAHAVPRVFDPLNVNVGGSNVLATAGQPDGKTLIADSVPASIPSSALGAKATVPSASKPQQLSSLDETPKGVATSDWQSIRAAYDAGRHAFQPTERGWQARNPGQQWTTSFDRRGFLAQPQDGGWQWGLELQSYGFGENQHRVSGTPEVRADGQRLSYQWDGAVREWFVNDQRGLEHGFTIAHRPDDGISKAKSQIVDSLSFTLVVRGTLTPRLTADALGVQFQNAAGATVLTYTGLKVWDADGQVLASRFEMDDHQLSSSNSQPTLRLLVDERAACYPITIDPIAQQAYLKASNTGAGDGFGLSVAVSGDTAVIGAFLEASNATGVDGNQADNSAGGSGAAYVFTRSGTTWTQQAYLKASNTGEFDRFGISVAVSGDTVVVGSQNESSNATGVGGDQGNNLTPESGAVYVFTRTGGTWAQQAYLKASNTGEYDHFGYSVSVSGDTAVIGAYGERSTATGVGGNQADNGALDSGAAYVFTRTGGTWTQQAYLKASNTGVEDYFGQSVAVSGDTAVIGAYAEDNNAIGVDGNQADNSAPTSGAAYVFSRSGTTWTQQAYLKSGSLQFDDRFGHSVAVSGDTAVIGAYQEDSNATGVGGNQANNSASNSGAAYVFMRSGTTWTQQAYLKASNTAVNDFFGHSVAVSGDTAVIGASGEDSNATGVGGNQADNTAGGSGAAYIFTGLGPVVAAPTVTAINPTSGSTAGGTPVTITGTAFTGATTVTIGGTAATSVSVVNATTITATTPAHAAGAASVLVTTPGGTNAPNTLYTFVAPPIVSASTANLLTTATSLVIIGSGFDATTPGNNSVVFTPAGSGTVTAATATSLTVTSLTGHTLGPLNAVVTTDGQSSGAAVQVATVVSNIAVLSALTTTAGTFTPSFAAATTGYSLSVPNATTTTTVTATSAEANATLQIQINGLGFNPLVSGSPSGALVLNLGANPVDVRVTAQDGTTFQTYTITVTRRSIIEDWRQGFFNDIANTGNFANTADFDSDGKTNLLEFALGTDPTLNTSGPPALTLSGTYPAPVFGTTGQPITIIDGVDFHAVFIRRSDHAAAGLTYTPEFSAGLSTWTASASVPTVLATSGIYELVSVPYPDLPPNKIGFFRVIVSITP